MNPSPTANRFLGLDLAWYGNGHTSALAVLEGNSEVVTLLEPPVALGSDAEIHGAISRQSTPDTVLAIDGPLVIKNVSGQRECEALIARRFSHAHAGAYPANLTLIPDARSLRLVNALASQGWGHDVNPERDHRRAGRWMFEVYPHPSHVVLFDLPAIVKYKKGRVPFKRSGLARFRNLISSILGAACPALTYSPDVIPYMETDLDGVRGKALKRYEDGLDAILCAYLAAHYWAWGMARNEMIGTMAEGYIVLPSVTAGGAAWSYTRLSTSQCR